MKTSSNGRLLRLGWAILLLVLSSCASDRRPLELADAGSGVRIVLEPGAHFSNLGWFGPIPFSKGPQMAIWAETSDGTFLRTVFVTGRSSRNDWIGAAQRPDALPVWSNRRAAKENTDAVTAPTQSVGQSAEIQARLPADVRLYLEVNLSYDWNETWSRALPKTDPHFNGENGQPSLVYRAVFPPGDLPAPLEFGLVGHGSATGADGAIDRDLTGIDTARDIVRSARVKKL